jgi:pyochelin biosynthesis protein PchG
VRVQGNTDRPMRVVVCGTTFGQIYLSAFQRSDCPFELAGILAQGSDRSHFCANRYGVPLFKDPEQLPDDIDIACVVVRSTAMGGYGTEIAKVLMARGINVLQEHPVHHDELAECLSYAHRHDVVYHMNTFYPHLAPVREFLVTAKKLLACQAPIFIDAACSIQVAYPLFDILGQVLGRVRPWKITEAPPVSEDLRQVTELDIPFRTLNGVIAGVPLTLRVQNQIDPSDPDNHLHLLHRITVGTEGGNLMLVNTHGPVLWNARLHIPAPTKDIFDLTSTDTVNLGLPSSVTLSPFQAPNFRDILGSIWPEGINHALMGLRNSILEGEDFRCQGQYQLALCRLWQATTSSLGYPEMVQFRPPQPISIADFASGTFTKEEEI